VAAALQKEPDTAVKMVEGNRGEFTVLVDGQEVLHKTSDTLPTVESVVTAVHNQPNALMATPY
jgi:hypothetical protein